MILIVRQTLCHILAIISLLFMVAHWNNVHENTGELFALTEWIQESFASSAEANFLHSLSFTDFCWSLSRLKAGSLNPFTYDWMLWKILFKVTKECLKSTCYLCCYFWSWTKCLEQAMLKIRMKSQEQCVFSGKEIKEHWNDIRKCHLHSHLAYFICCHLDFTAEHKKYPALLFMSCLQECQMQRITECDIISLVYSSPINLTTLWTGMVAKTQMLLAIKQWEIPAPIDSAMAWILLFWSF